VQDRSGGGEGAFGLGCVAENTKGEEGDVQAGE
jgi:hypothetical protein